MSNDYAFEIIRDEGSKAYYEEVPRYKNPHELNSEFMSLWYKGWDQSKSDHDLFTENQTLKAKIEVLKKSESMGLESLKISVDIIASHTDTIETLENERASALEENMFLVDDVAKLVSQMAEISTLLDSSYYYCTDSSIFSFRREKLIDMIKILRKKVGSPEVKKNNPKDIEKS